MKRISSLIAKSLIAVVAAGAMLAGTAQAQLSQVMTATIPFGFSADGNNVAAGTYKVELLSERTLWIRNVDSGKQLLLMVRPDVGRAVESQGKLIFHRFEGRNYLSEIRIAGSTITSDVREKHSSNPEQASLGSSESTVMVALQ